MKLKDILGKAVENKKNGQLNVSVRKNKLKKIGLSKDDLFNMNLDIKVKRMLFED